MASQSFGVIGLNPVQKWKWNSAPKAIIGIVCRQREEECGDKGVAKHEEGEEMQQSLKSVAPRS